VHISVKDLKVSGFFLRIPLAGIIACKIIHHGSPKNSHGCIRKKMIITSSREEWIARKSFSM